MLFELIGTLVAGVAAALLVWALTRLTGGRLPRWLVPVAAGAAMLAATISSEYGWYDRTTATMPEGLVVAEAIEEAVFYRPWTYLAPLTTRFVAVDLAGMRTHPDHPDQRLVDLVFYGRWARPARVPMAFDCAEGRQADIVDGVDFAENGAITGVDWLTVAADDPLQEAACGTL